MRDQAFERLYAEHAQPLTAFLAYRTGDLELAKDLLADTFERVLRARRRFDPRKSSEKTWLYTIALNLLRDRLRREAAEDRALAKAGGAAAAPQEELLDAVAERDELKRALRTLSEDEQEAIALRFGADLTIPEMARVLGESHTTAHGRVYRALRKLREDLGE